MIVVLEKKKRKEPEKGRVTLSNKEPLN